VQRFLIGVSGASGSILAVRLLEVLRDQPDVEVHLITTPAALRTLTLEMPDYPVSRLRELVDEVHDCRDIAAPPSSGTWPHDGMAIVPCSISSASAIALGLGTNLLLRAADVTLKERRNLVVVPRETPLHLGHLQTLARLAELGACVVPPMLAFYQKPKTMADLVDHVVARVLDQLHIEHDLQPPWSGAGDA